jgi:UDPglucose 6-dehydrogenase
VIGAGYVGLVTAACLARLGHAVCCIDQDRDRIEALRSARVPIFEPGLDEIVAEGLSSGQLCFESDLSAAHDSSIAMIAVGTLDAAGEWSARHVERAVLETTQDASLPRTIVIRSTLAPGTGVALERRARELDERVAIVVNPEFTRQGSAVRDFLSPDRIVVGATEPDSAQARAALEIYRPLDAPVIVTDVTSAEMIKFGSNVFLALKIGYANELSRLSAALGADISAVTRGVGMDPRIGPAFLSPGPGFGGSCLPSQSRAMPEVARRSVVSTSIVDAIAQSNRSQAEWMVDCLSASLGGYAGRHVAVLGATFKAGTDDLRESPAIAMARTIGRRGATLTVHDPLAGAAAAALLTGEGLAADAATSALDAARDADALVVATEWPEYSAIDWLAFAAVMRGRWVLDARGIVDADRAHGAGLSVSVLGAPSGSR